MSKYKDDILRLRDQGLSYRAIEKELGCSRATVAYHCQGREGNVELILSNRDHFRRTLNIPQSKEALLRWLLLDGVQRKNIADALSLPYQDVLRFARKECLAKSREELSNYERVKRRRRHLKMLAVAMLGGKCIRCGYHRSLRAMDFHHPDPDGKDFSVSTNANRAWSKMKAEVAKCVLLCSNCHREEHDLLVVYAPMPLLI